MGVASKSEQRRASVLCNEFGAILLQALPASSSLNALKNLIALRVPLKERRRPRRRQPDENWAEQIQKQQRRKNPEENSQCAPVACHTREAA